LHWFKWEAYTTWLSGFALLTIVYYFNAPAMMIDRSVADLGAWQAIAIGVGSMVIGWTVYDLLCRSPLAKKELLLGVMLFLLLVFAAWGLSKLLSGRAAFLHVGAIIGTIMVGNVLMIIIPGQRKMVDAMRAGGSPDPIHGLRGKQRSVHNNYFTLPVVFIMISNHYAMTYSHAWNWLVLAAIMAAGVLIRHFFNLRHKGRIAWGYPAAGLALLLLTAVVIAPRPSGQGAAGGATAAVDFGRVQSVIGQRCVSCHAERPTQAGFASAPAGIMLQTAEQIHRNAEKIYRQAAQLKAMPIGNLTGMTDEERMLIARWYEGATNTNHVRQGP
ncbi:MAG: conserved hypothetical rane protein, partial [Noviherbaspirillum sp.]|nr:conserved hypothetical rane protein [Noviherbaspirillum sp.]